MQDIDDFDPLDDLLLSDEDNPAPKISIVNSPSHNKTNDLDLDGELKKEKKKKIIAELFGTDVDEPKLDVKSIPVTPSTLRSNSDWLELKTDSENQFAKSTTTNVSQETADLSELRTSTHKPNVDQINVTSLSNKTDRRKSVFEKTPDLRKSKQHFKSLDLDLFDFDSSPSLQKNGQPPEESNPSIISRNHEVKEDLPFKANDDQGRDTYVPSSNVNRRLGSSQLKNIRFEKRDWLSTFMLDDSEGLSSNEVKAESTLPTWLKPKELPHDNLEGGTEKEIKSSNHDKNRNIFPTESETLEDGNEITKDVLVKTGKQTEAEYNDVETTKNRKIVIAPTIAGLKKKQAELKQLVKNQTESMATLEQEIRDTAVDFIHEQRDQQRDNIKALLELISFDESLNESSLPKSTFRNSENQTEHVDIVSQLQMKLSEKEFEKTEFEMKLKYAERKHIIDLSMLEDVYKCKLQVADEREEHYLKKIQNLENEYDKKLSKRKEEEEELIRVFNEKIKILKEEHVNELKHIAEVQSLRNPWKLFVNPSEKAEANTASEREMVLREIAIEEKYKELSEFEERLNRQKRSLDTKEINLNTRIEEFEIKIAKEKLYIEGQKKEIKSTQTILEEKQIYVQQELQREKDHLASYKQELEVIKEELLNQEGKLIKEKFEICAERARLEAIINAEGSQGGVRDMIQSRAELQGTIDELRRLKSKLESERNEVKTERMRLREESWSLREIEQELRLQQKNFDKMLRESETKREEGADALKKARKIESQFDQRTQEIEKRVLELNRKEELLTQEKIELSKERDLLTKKRYQLDMMLPQLSFEEQMPFNLLNKNLFDPRIMLMKLGTESTLNE